MNSTPLHRRAIRDYDEIRRMAIEATEREAHVIHESRAISSKSAADIQPPEPCNFCAPDDLAPATDRFAELAKVLGRYWLLWLIAFTGAVRRFRAAGRGAGCRTGGAVMSIETVQHAVHVRNVLGHVSHALKTVGVFGKLDNVVVNEQPAAEYIADLLPALDDAASAVGALVSAARRVTRAFRALGEDGPSIFLRQQQVTECEQAMVALDAALAAMADAP